MLTVLLAVADCGSGGDSPKTSSASASSTPPALSTVSVTNEADGKPKIKMPIPFSAIETNWRVIREGQGQKLTSRQRVTVDYTGFNGADGREFDSTIGAGKKPSSFLLDSESTLPGLVKGLIGQAIGSRMLIAIPPSDAYGTAGVPSAGIGPTDTILVVVDIRAGKDVLTRASGIAIQARDGLPSVRLDQNGKPTIALPSGNPPNKLVIQPLIHGSGAKVEKGEQIRVHYTGVIWPGGKEFDSSWDKGAPASFPIGTGQVIPGWDEGLVGQSVGSQILLVIPPDKGYGAAGRPEAGIKGTDVLVFVVDILDAA